ncbi:MAG: hypothetical protein HY298_02355 [Verrucomicrobia bacterium]|nr:hypothetical protein [Verrucomicrobiota bacterium]
MKKYLVVLAFTLSIVAAFAQEQIDRDQARRIAQRLTESFAKLDNIQFKMEADAEKPSAFAAGGGGILVIPDKKLTKESMTKVGAEILPLGQLWMLNIAPAPEGKATPKDKLRLVTVNAENEEHKLPLCLLGVRKKADTLELVVYGKDKEPLLSTPLKKSQLNQELPVELTGEQTGDDSGVLTINVLGNYQATLKMVSKPEEEL